MSDELDTYWFSLVIKKNNIYILQLQLQLQFNNIYILIYLI
jgi:hypothetical protein